MATYKKNWTSQTQIIGSGGGYSTLSGTTETFSSDVDMDTNGYEGAHVIPEVNFDATPTDDVTINVYGSHDGTNYDDTPVYSITIDNGTDPNQISIIVKGLSHFRVGAVQTGSTDSHDVRCYYKAWNYTDA